MKVQSVTVGLPVSDLLRSVEWYRDTFELREPDLEPADGVVEFRLGGVWLQLVQEEPAGSTGRIVLRVGVRDVASERARLAALGVPVGALEAVAGVIEYFEFADPDGNRLSLYAEVEP